MAVDREPDNHGVELGNTRAARPALVNTDSATPRLRWIELPLYEWHQWNGNNECATTAYGSILEFPST